MKDRRILIIFFVVLVDMLSFSIVLPLLPYLATELNASAAMIGLLGAVYPAAQFIAAPILGQLSDRYGRKPILLLSIAGTAAGFVVLATARVLPILFVSRLMDGITGGNISVAQAYIADITEEKDRGAALGMIGAAFGLGFIIGPALGGLLTGISYSAPAWLGAALALINLVLVAVFVHESLSPEDRARLVARKRPLFDLGAFRQGLAHRRVGPLLGIRTISSLAFAIFESGFALWAIASLGLTAQANGLVLAYVGVLSVIVQAVVVGRLTKRYSDDRLLVVSLLTAGVGLVAWAFVSEMWMLIAIMPLLSFGLAVTNTVLSSALTKAVHRDEVGGILGFQTSITSLTRIPAPALAGVLIQYATVWAPGLLAGVLTLGLVPYAYKALCMKAGDESCEEHERFTVASHAPLPPDDAPVTSE